MDVMKLETTPLSATLAIRADERALPLVTFVHLARYCTRNMSTIALGHWRRLDWLQSEVCL